MFVDLPANGWLPRPYQEPLWDYLDKGGCNAVAVWHRRAGKDEIALHHTAKAAHRRRGNYWHMLPEAAQARKVIWDAINPRTGRKRIDEVFPHELRRKTVGNEMKIEFHVGSIWQVVGSDNFNSLIGSPPVGVVYSEWAVADPRAHGFLRPIMAENGGWSLFIYTSRGYNHGYSTYEAAKTDPAAFAERLTALDTKVFTNEVLERERRAYQNEYGTYEGDALFRQEYFCDFSAANIGAILGRYVEDAEKEGRISDDVKVEKDGSLIEISGDIGFRDAAAWWYWQPRFDGFALVDYDEDVGLDAQEWIPRLEGKGHKIGKVWLPHDAMAKNMAWRHSVAEQFSKHFGPSRIRLLPQGPVQDRINAARTMMRYCMFNRERCVGGLAALRAWQYEYNEETKIYSRTPRHDWASNGSDAYSYGAQVMKERRRPDMDKRFSHLPKKGTMEWLTTEAWKGQSMPGLSKRPLG